MDITSASLLHSDADVGGQLGAERHGATGIHRIGEHSLPVLLRAALAHVQFETIHPFLDGNGRLGYAALRRRPLTSTKQLKELSGLSFPTAGKAIETLVQLGIAREITGGRRNRLFAYDTYLARRVGMGVSLPPLAPGKG